MSNKAPRTEVVQRDCIASQVRLLNRVITNLYDDALRPLGLRVSQMGILVATSNLGLARPADLCRALHMDASTLSRNVERMRRKGWLEIAPGEDFRSRPFRLTPRAKRLLDRALPDWKRAQDEAAALLGERGSGLLRRITRAIGPEA